MKRRQDSGDEVHEAISIFAAKVERLERSSLCRFMTSMGWKIGWDFTIEQPSANAQMPEEEHLEAYILNLRFFLQDNEPTSLRNMSALYEEHCNDRALVHRFGELRSVINSALDQPLWYRFNDQRVTYRTVVMGMIYSEYAHANKAGHALFQQMIAHPFGRMIAVDDFLRCIAVVHAGLILIKNLNIEAFPVPGQPA